jgi:hypothetical protein
MRKIRKREWIEGEYVQPERCRGHGFAGRVFLRKKKKDRIGGFYHV